MGLPVSYTHLTGYSHTTEMEAIANVNATPTALIVVFIEGILAQPQKTYLPVVFK